MTGDDTNAAGRIMQFWTLHTGEHDHKAEAAIGPIFET